MTDFSFRVIIRGLSKIWYVIVDDLIYDLSEQIIIYQ